MQTFKINTHVLPAMEAVGEGFQVQFWGSEPMPRARELLGGQPRGPPARGRARVRVWPLLGHTGPCVGVDGFLYSLRNISQGWLFHSHIEEMCKVQFSCPERLFSSSGFSEGCLTSSKSPRVLNPDVTPLTVAGYPARFLA